MPQFHLSTKIEDEDWDPLFVIQWNAFKNSPAVRALSPGGLDPSQREANVAGFKIGLFGGPVERAYAKISEDQGDQITSFISCRVYRGPLGIIDGEYAQPPPPRKLPRIEDKNEREFWEWYWTSLTASMRRLKVLQTPHLYIQVLCTDPEWQGHGAATMLLQWIFSFVVETGLAKCVLQSSPLNKVFYEKFGFYSVHSKTYLYSSFPQLPMPFKHWVQATFSKVRRSAEAVVVTKNARVKPSRIRPRTTTLGVDGGGSFTDASAYSNFFCSNDDYDPCANGDSGCDTDTELLDYSLYGTTSTTTTSTTTTSTTTTSTKTKWTAQATATSLSFNIYEWIFNSGSDSEFYGVSAVDAYSTSGICNSDSTTLDDFKAGESFDVSTINKRRKRWSGTCTIRKSSSSEYDYELVGEDGKATGCVVAGDDADVGCPGNCQVSLKYNCPDAACAKV